MFTFFNPFYVVGGLGLVSSPIIIHLINRMRYKRIRWAAMEFLLKSQKKNRRRLIIEQMILLFLRCLLVVLALLLAARLLECTILGHTVSLGPRAKHKTVHVVLLDDSLSMTDRVIDRLGTPCFEVARNAVHDEIAVFAGRSSSPQDLVLVLLSELATKKGAYKPKIYQRLGEKATRDELRKDL